MDLNLHLLHPDQLRLIQDICRIPKGVINGHYFDGFEEVRDKIDLIILDESTGYSMYEEDLKHEEEEIRERIRKEKELWGDRDFPKLPNYDDPKNPQPIWATLDDPNLKGSQPITPLKQFIEWKPGKGVKPSLASIIEYMTDDEDGESYSGSLTKFQLLQLDARLARIKWNRLRLASKTITGCYMVWKNRQNRKDKKVYLFPEAIEKSAMLQNVDFNCALAGTFIHEMFHAYFDDTKAKGFIYEEFFRVTEIEEAVTECSTLHFISQHYNHYLSSIETEIKNKFDNGSTGLYCYGVGYYLYEANSIKNLINKYRKVQRTTRYSTLKVREYLREVQGNSPDHQKCVNYLVLLIYYFNKLVKKNMKHYAFNGKQYGWEIHLVRAVLKYYVAKNNPTLTQMQTDFNTAANKDFFEELSLVQARGKEKEYDLDTKITLACGTVIVPRNKWANKKKDDNTPRFIDEVKLMYYSPAKIIDVEINVLR